MALEAGPVEIAVLDDYQGVALEMADWSVLNGRAADHGLPRTTSRTIARWSNGA